MQFLGGWKYPTNAILVFLSMTSILMVLAMSVIKQTGVMEGSVLFLNLEGTAFLASAFTPVGLSPPAGQGMFSLIKHILSSQNTGTSVSFCPWMFYLGFGLLFAATALNFMTK